MVDNLNDLLPIGSVVLLKNGKRKLMIIGIKPIDVTNNITHDYLAVPYPEGFIDDRLTFFIEHSKIEQVIARGYENEERESFISEMNELYKSEV